VERLLIKISNSEEASEAKPNKTPTEGPTYYQWSGLSQNNFAFAPSIRAVGCRSLGLFWIKGFGIGLLRENIVAPQPLGSSPASTHCACDLPGWTTTP